MRRYPALGFLAVAAALALILPSRLTTPRTDPATLAQFAPVPGRGEGAGSLSDVGAAASDGLGSSREGSSGRSSGSGSGPNAGPGRRDLTLKRCVGRPPRQTEDPLSPPCVAYFEGDNFGATWQGVTRDEVTVVAYFGAPSVTPYGRRPPDGTVVDYDEPPSPDDFPYDYAMKVYVKYFNERYQTYNRRVHVIGYWGSGSSTASVRHADAQKVADQFEPFATVTLATTPTAPYVFDTAARGIMSVSFDAYARDAYRRAAPYLWSALPDLEDESALATSYICKKLKGRPAKHSGNSDDLTRTRTFGIAYTDSDEDPEYAKLKDLMVEDLRRCGIDPVVVGIPSGNVDGQRAGPGAVATFRSEGVTTVIVQSTALYVASAATAAHWYPEWFVPGRRVSSSIDQPGPARVLPQDQWRHAMGVSFVARWGDANAQHWSRTYRETCGCDLQAKYWTSTFYDPFAMLFYGIQAAGPRLTPQSFDKGMHAIPPRGSVGPYSPAAYFTPGNYSYLKDAMEIWWDPENTGPGDDKPGCYRIPNDGRRFRAGEWLPGDEDAFVTGPCNGAAPYP